MEIQLTKKPKNPIIIEGFPGFGLVGTITTEFLIEHLQTEQIGKIMLDEMPAIVAIHENKVVQPLGVYYSKKYNLVLLHAINSAQGHEWKLADAISKLAKDLGATEIVSIEGVGSTGSKDSKGRTFYYTNNISKEKILSKIADPLKEGIIMGVTGAVLLRVEKIPLSCIFAEAKTDLPDSNAAARIIEVLDKYLGLDVDTKPLLKQAAKFEDKLKSILSRSREVEEMSDKKKLSYVG
ncbi:MAG: PAC2 family protein [Candidatus Woesearchaeota archaeon]